MKNLRKTKKSPQGKVVILKISKKGLCKLVKKLSFYSERNFSPGDIISITDKKEMEDALEIEITK